MAGIGVAAVEEMDCDGDTVQGEMIQRTKPLSGSGLYTMRKPVQF